MNNPNHPLIPQGSILDQKNTGRTRVRIAVFFVLAIHVVGLMALLMQGCRRQDTAETPLPEFDTNSLPATTFDPMNVPVDPLTNMTAATATPPVDVNMGATLPPPAPTTTEYVVLSGDNFTTIGRKFGVSVRAIQDANPTVNPNRLQIGTKLQIPPPPVPTSTAAATAAPAPANGEEIYTVVSGDNLTKIATKYGTTPKAIRTANPELTSDRIIVGQKLRIPVQAAPAQ